MMEVEQTLKSKKLIPDEDRTLLISEAWDRPTRIQILLWVLITVGMIGISLLNFLGYQVGSRFDEDRYLILARSLVSADRYGMVNSPGEPLPERFPFGYPLLISPIVWLFPDNLDAPKLLSLAATVLNAALLFWAWPWFSRRRSYWWGVAIAGLYALSPLTIDFSRRIMSEAVFLTFSLISILLAEKLVGGNSNRWLIPGLGVALTFVVFTRTIGFVLLVSVLFYLLLKQGKSGWTEIVKIGLLIGLLTGLIVAATPVRLVDLFPSWYLQNDKNARPLVSVVAGETADTSAEASDSTVTSGPQRFESIQRLARSGFRNIFGESLRWITLPFGLGALRKIFEATMGNPSLMLQMYGYLVSGLVILGICLLIFQEQFSLFSVYPLLYLGALFFWNFNSPRLFYPIQPQIQLGWLVVLEALALWLLRSVRDRNSSGRAAQLGFAALIIVMSTGSITNTLLLEDSSVHAGDLRIRTQWLKDHTRTSDIIMTEKPEVDYLYSERKTVPYPQPLPSDEKLETYLISNSIDYILVAPRLGWFEHYSPVYSDQMDEFMPAFERLQANHRIRLVYSLDSDLIRAYQVQRSFGPP